jgi:DNA polymerase (family 10)
MTDRVLAAVRSGVLSCLGHPFGRMIGKRDPINLDLDRIMEACAEENVCLEINAEPERLDLPDIHCRRAREAGVKLVISTDAHKPADLDLIRYGIYVARRGWLRRQDVINTSTLASFKKKPFYRRP